MIPCSSQKRKHPDDEGVSDEDVLDNDGPLREQPIENEYEHLDDDDDDDQVDRKAPNDEVDHENMLKAQEPTTIPQYDNIKITPFNLEEELEDGEFDKSGNFIFKKEQTDEDCNDTWAESVDWAAVEAREKELKKKKLASTKPTNEAVKQDDKSETRTPMTCYSQMLRIMRADETVQKTIRRLGNLVPKRRPKKKSADPEMDTYDGDAVAEAKRKLDLMIETAHQLLEEGDTDIYQKSYEDLEDAINQTI